MFPSVNMCSKRLRATVNKFNQTFENYAAPGDKLLEDYVFNFTRVLSNETAETAGDCYLGLYEIWSYYYLKSTLFADGLDYLQAFLQNLIGNIITFNTVYTQIT